MFTTKIFKLGAACRKNFLAQSLGFFSNAALSYAAILASNSHGAPEAGEIFRIGIPDARSAEFKTFRNLGDDRYKYLQGYKPEFRPFRDVDACAEFFSKPVVFKVGKSKDKDWPFVHPFVKCRWAGQKAGSPMPAFSVEFDSPKNPASEYWLKLGLADSSESGATGLKFVLNGKEVGSICNFYTPFFFRERVKGKNGCSSSLIYFPNAEGVPSNLQPVKVPSELLAKNGGGNILEILPLCDKNAGMPMWVAYDFIELSANPSMPEIPDKTRTLPERAAQSMGTSKIVFCTTGQGRDWHWYANYGRSIFAKTNNAKIDKYFDAELFSRLGGKIVVYDILSGQCEVILDDPLGGVRDIQVSYDAKKILFSYRKGDGDLFHIYEIDADGKNLTKLPFAANCNDIEPCYMPNGDILFTSDRLNKTVQCFFVPVSNLYRWFRNANVVRTLTVNPDVDNRPEMLPDGRIIYTRWDYNHRTQLGYHSLWTISPEGMSDMVYLGNDIPGGLFIGAKPLPDKDGAIFILSPDHGIKDHRGCVARAVQPFDPSDPYAVEYLCAHWKEFYDPYPLCGGLALVSLGDRLGVMDHCGQIYCDFKLPENLFKSSGKTFMNVASHDRGNLRQPECVLRLRNPQPLAPRKKPAEAPSLADFSKDTATVFVQDVYHGRKMSGVEKGSVKELMIVQMLPEPAHYHGGTEPLNLQGGFALEKILGTVPVQEDGSAAFEVPARTALAFVALDKDGRNVKRMQSFVGFAPDTNNSCLGCHEMRNTAPAPKKSRPLAYGKISKIKPLEGVPPIVDFTRDIQPLLDKYCLPCHNAENLSGKILLDGGLGTRTIHSRFMLTASGQIVTGQNAWGNYEPYGFGSGASKIMDKALGAHRNKKFTPQDAKILRAWLDTGAPQISAYSAVNTGFIHSFYYESLFRLEDGTPDALKKINESLDNSCSKCHPKDGLPYAFVKDIWQRMKIPDGKGGFKDGNIPCDMLYNLSVPEHSLVLTIPLGRKKMESKTQPDISKGAKPFAHPTVFKDKNDPEYKKLSAAIAEVALYAEKQSPFYTSPNFRPSAGYIKQMQKCGILPPDHKFDTPINPFEIDEKYFEWVREHLTQKVEPNN